jgi:hypothetical protein
MVVNYVNIWERGNILDRGRSKCKAPEIIPCLISVCYRKSKISLGTAECIEGQSNRNKIKL